MNLLEQYQRDMELLKKLRPAAEKAHAALERERAKKLTGGLNNE